MIKRLLLFLLLSAAPAFGADFYTSTTGSDAAAGTIGAPWNLANGFASEFSQIGVATGDTLHMCIGACDGAGSGSAAATINAGAYPDGLTLRGYTGETVTIGTVYIWNNADVTLQNFNIDGRVAAVSSDTLDVLSSTNVLVEDMDIGWALDHVVVISNTDGGAANTVTMRRLVVHDAAQTQSGTDYGEHGFYIVKNFDGPDDTILLYDIEIYNVTGPPAIAPYSINWGMHIYGAVDPQGLVTMYNLNVHDNSNAVLITACTNCAIYNSKIWDNTFSGITLGVYGTTALNPAAYNNSIYNSNKCFEYGDYDSIATNNACYGNTTSDGFTRTNFGSTGVVTTSNNHTSGVDPLWTDEANGDFTLETGSPLIDAGANLSAIFTIDEDGISRPQGNGWDIGSTERIPFTGGSSPNTRDAPIISENCTGTTAPLTAPNWTQALTSPTTDKDGAGLCDGSAPDDMVISAVLAAGSYSNQQFASVTFKSIGTSTVGASFPTVGCFGAGANSTLRGYFLSHYNASGVLTTSLNRVTANVPAVIGGNPNVTLALNDTFTIECNATTGRIIGLQNSTVIIDVTDATYTNGVPMVGANGDATIDDVTVGNMNSATPSIPGTVSPHLRLRLRLR